MSIYGENSINASEKSATDPISFYGILNQQEKILLKLDKKTKLVILGLYNVYGPGQDFNNFKQGMLSIYLSQIYKFKKVNITGSVKDLEILYTLMMLQRFQANLLLQR